MQFGQLFLRKIIKIVATRCQILRLKCTKFDFGWGSSKNVVPFRWIISKKDCVISDVDIGEMKVANIDSKTARTVSHEPINRTAKERRSKYTTLTDS